MTTTAVTAAIDALDAAWDELARHWDEPARHDALLGLVAQAGAYAWAAGKYKARGDDPIAARQLERIRRAALAAMFATAAPKREERNTPFKSSILLLLVVAVLAGIGIAYSQFQRARVTQTQPR